MVETAAARDHDTDLSRSRVPSGETEPGSQWVHRLANQVQSLVLVLVLDLLEPVECLARARQIAHSTPPPTREIDRICGVRIFLELAIRLSRRLHAQVRSDRACACQLTIPRLVEELIVRPSPPTRFLAWVDRFASAFRGEHPGTPASYVARLLRAEPRRHWTIDTLAERVGCRPRSLGREFRATFGLTVHRYLETARVAAVFDELCQDRYKISAVADDAGYKSPKDFYRAVRNCLQRTPGGVRALSDADQQALGQLLRAVLTQNLVGLDDIDEPPPTRLPSPRDSRRVAKAFLKPTSGERTRMTPAPSGRARKKWRSP
jgi:AraC-like DNA-binding protein